MAVVVLELLPAIGEAVVLARTGGAPRPERLRVFPLLGWLLPRAAVNRDKFIESVRTAVRVHAALHLRGVTRPACVDPVTRCRQGIPTVLFGARFPSAVRPVQAQVLYTAGWALSQSDRQAQPLLWRPHVCQS